MTSRTRVAVGLVLLLLVGCSGQDNGQDNDEAQGQIGVAGGHDWWSIALSRRAILIPDGFQEQLLLYDEARRLTGTVSGAAIGQALAAAEVVVERSPGPPGVRDAVAHPNGGWVVLIAGLGSDVLLRVHDERGLSVLSSNFGEAMTRGDEIGNFPRITIGGSPPAILVTVQAPQAGVAVVGMDGRLLHTLPLKQQYHGVAVVPGTNRLYLLRADGAVERYDDLHNTTLAPGRLAALPQGVRGRDLAYNAVWCTLSPNLIAVGSDGRVYTIELATGHTEVLERAGLEGVIAVDIEDALAAFARDETAWLDDGCP